MQSIVSFSGGKDSTAMLLKMIENNMPIDEIIFCDTGKEFPQMYEHINKIMDYIKRPITILYSEKSFDYYMFEHEKTRGKNKGQKGYGWSSGRCRWCTTLLKNNVINKYLSKYKEEGYIEYIGIAYDEQNRMRDKVYPLVDWKMTEKDCLEYCYSKGFNWGGLYEHLDRVRKAYMSILDEYSLQKIDGNNSIDNIFKQIATRINHRLNEREEEMER